MKSTSKTSAKLELPKIDSIEALDADIAALEAALKVQEATAARKDFRTFVEQAWPVLEPGTKFVPGIHVDAICKHLQAVIEGKIKDLIVNVPPGFAKSLTTCVFWPAWAWIDHPELRWLFSSYRADLAVRDSVKCRTLIESEWYQKRWGKCFQLQGDQNEKKRFANNKTGYRAITSVGTGTGERGDIVVVDDPMSVDQSESDAERATANDWWNGTMSTRLNDLKKGHRVVIQQRLHEQDTTAICLEQGGYEHLVLPLEFEPERRCTTSIGWTDPRKEEGELLWPEKVGPTEVADLKVKLGSYRYAGQFQQRPSPAGGGIFQRHWWRYWKYPGTELPPVRVKMPNGDWMEVEAQPLPGVSEQIQSWDLSFKDTVGADFVCGIVAGMRGADRYILAVDKRRLDFPATCAAIKQMSERFPRATAKLVEDKANGPAVISALKSQIGGLIAVNPEGGKIARAHAVAPLVEAGNVYLPHPGIATWVNEYIESMASFPNAAHDDDVDATTQMLSRRTSSVFPVAEEEVIIQPFAIPDDWVRVCGLHIGPRAVGAVWMARDPRGKFYLFDEYFRENADATVHAAELKRRGSWVPVVFQAQHAHSEEDRRQILHAYQDLGLDIHKADGKSEAGLDEMGAAMISGNLKVFATLSRWMEEFRLLKRDSDDRLINASQSFCQNAARHVWTTGRELMRTAPVKRANVPRFGRSLVGSWMN